MRRVCRKNNFHIFRHKVRMLGIFLYDQKIGLVKIMWKFPYIGSADHKTFVRIVCPKTKTLSFRDRIANSQNLFITLHHGFVFGIDIENIERKNTLKTIQKIIPCQILFAYSLQRVRDQLGSQYIQGKSYKQR